LPFGGLLNETPTRFPCLRRLRNNSCGKLVEIRIIFPA
jgi:hypothetical protein